MIRALTLAALLAALTLTASPADAKVLKTDPWCEVTGDRNPLVRDVSLCAQASYTQRAGVCPKWRRTLIGIGVGGRHLTEGNGAVLRRVTIRKASGVYLGNHYFDNLFEYADNRYRRFYELDPTRSRWLEVYVNAELLIAHGRNRAVSFTAYLYGFPC